jgi:pimeloyl-ACP methyl ester carboxylesterase
LTTSPSALPPTSTVLSCSGCFRPSWRTRSVAVDLPSEDESAGWSEYTDTVVRAVGDRGDLVVVGHSLGGFTAPLVFARLPAKLLVLVAAMIPAPGEFFNDWWRNSGYEGTEYEDVFYHWRDDRMFPAAWARRHAHGRLRIEADELDGGHYISLSRPRELAEHLHAYAAAKR